MMRTKRIFQRLSISFQRNTIKPKSPLNEFENEILQICRSLIHSSESELSISPKSGKRFIDCRVLQTKILIKDNLITFSNPETYYKVGVSQKGFDSIIRIFDGNLNSKVDSLESQMEVSAKNILTNVISLTNRITRKN